MKKLTYFIFIFSIIILLIAIFSFIINNKVIQTQTFYASVNVTDSLAFDTNGTALTFGSIAQYGSSLRNIVFNNNYEFPVVAKINIEGDIEPLLEFDESVYIDKGEEKKITFTVYSKNTSLGFYSGNVELKILPA